MLDEAAHIDPNLFYKTIVPILQLKNTSLLALSSPEGNENYYSQLLNLKDEHGNPWFKVVNKKMVCAECQKGDRAKQLSCSHVPKTEEWLSNRKFERLKALYANAKGTAIQELLGMAVSEFVPCFNTDDIDACFTAPRVLTKTSPGWILIGLDPTGQGPSKLGIAAAYVTTHGHIVVRRNYLTGLKPLFNRPKAGVNFYLLTQPA